jgi:hypothetical protein
VKGCIAAAVALVLACSSWAGPALASGQPSSWSETKCARYTAAWSALMTRRGPYGLGADFLGRHEAFIVSGCTSAPDVCPQSVAELNVANIMVIAAMNAGTASTFPPFRCPR